jgi:hypothetical protein
LEEEQAEQQEEKLEEVAKKIGGGVWRKLINPLISSNVMR